MSAFIGVLASLKRSVKQPCLLSRRIIHFPLHTTAGYTARVVTDTVAKLMDPETSSIDLCDEKGDGEEGSMSWSRPGAHGGTLTIRTSTSEGQSSMAIALGDSVLSR